VVVKGTPARGLGGTSTATRAITHVDMDAFYAAIEQARSTRAARPAGHRRREPDRPRRGLRGVVRSATVRRALGDADRTRGAALSNAAFLPVDMQKYQRVSVQVMHILADFSPLVEPVSVDEAFVDLTGTESLFGSPLDAVRRIKRRIVDETGLTASAGLAANKFVAKVASDLEKPTDSSSSRPAMRRGSSAPCRSSGSGAWDMSWPRSCASSASRRSASSSGPRAAVLARRFGKHGDALYDLPSAATTAPSSRSACPSRSARRKPSASTAPIRRSSRRPCAPMPSASRPSSEREASQPVGSR